MKKHQILVAMRDLVFWTGNMKHDSETTKVGSFQFDDFSDKKSRMW